MKKRITPIPIAPPKLKTDTISSGNLPNADEVNQTVAQLTGKTIEPPAEPAPEQKPAPPQPVQEIAATVTVPPTEATKTTATVEPKMTVSQPTVAPVVPTTPVVVPAATVIAPTPTVTQVQTVVLKTFGRPPKPEAVGRDKFTTRLKTELVVELKTRAAKRKITVADLIEMIVGENYERY